jgi:hypothetical protein
MHDYDWANLAGFEPWFAIMGLLLIACALAPRGQDTRGPVTQAPRTRASTAGTAVALAGLFAVLCGVLTFTPWIFAGVGPALMVAGLALRYLRRPRDARR